MKIVKPKSKNIEMKKFVKIEEENKSGSFFVTTIKYMMYLILFSSIGYFVFINQAKIKQSYKYILNEAISKSNKYFGNEKTIDNSNKTNETFITPKIVSKINKKENNSVISPITTNILKSNSENLPIKIQNKKKEDLSLKNFTVSEQNKIQIKKSKLSTPKIKIESIPVTTKDNSISKKKTENETIKLINSLNKNVNEAIQSHSTLNKQNQDNIKEIKDQYSSILQSQNQMLSKVNSKMNHMQNDQSQVHKYLLDQLNIMKDQFEKKMNAFYTKEKTYKETNNKTVIENKMKTEKKNVAVKVEDNQTKINDNMESYFNNMNGILTKDDEIAINDKKLVHQNNHHKKHKKRNNHNKYKKYDDKNLKNLPKFKSIRDYEHEIDSEYFKNDKNNMYTINKNETIEEMLKRFKRFE